MTDKNTILQIFGSLLQHPQYLSQSDKYNLSPSDFEDRLERYIFVAIDSLYRSNATNIQPIDVENYLSSNAAAANLFKNRNGIEYLQDAISFAKEDNFPYYYKKLKKINLLNALKKIGVNTEEFYIENLTDPKALEVNKKFESLELEDIVNTVKKKIIELEKQFIQDEGVQSWNIDDEIDDLINNFGKIDNIGKSINGDIISSIINGAEIRALTIRSCASGIGKTRLAVADACKLAYPFYWDLQKQKWVKNGHNEKVLFIMTEQTPEQMMRMVVAYLTGIEDSKLRFGKINDEERTRVMQAREIIRKYHDNLELMRIPDPDIDQIKLAVRERVITTQVKYVFFDYIFVSPALLQQFKGSNLRNDEALLLMATALKDLAIEQNVSVFTSTQVNAKADDNSNIRNEAALAGGRATINKADNGIIGARPTNEEKTYINEKLEKQLPMMPNLVFDIYKVRSGRWTQVRVWSYFDTGNLRLTDLFLTDSMFQPIDDFYSTVDAVDWESDSDEEEFLRTLNHD